MDRQVTMWLSTRKFYFRRQKKMTARLWRLSLIISIRWISHYCTSTLRRSGCGHVKRKIKREFVSSVIDIISTRAWMAGSSNDHGLSWRRCIIYEPVGPDLVSHFPRNSSKYATNRHHSISGHTSFLFIILYTTDTHRHKGGWLFAQVICKSSSNSLRTGTQVTGTHYDTLWLYTVVLPNLDDGLNIVAIPFYSVSFVLFSFSLPNRLTTICSATWWMKSDQVSLSLSLSLSLLLRVSQSCVFKAGIKYKTFVEGESFRTFRNKLTSSAWVVATAFGAIPPLFAWCFSPRSTAVIMINYCRGHASRGEFTASGPISESLDVLPLLLLLLSHEGGATE